MTKRLKLYLTVLIASCIVLYLTYHFFPQIASFESFALCFFIVVLMILLASKEVEKKTLGFLREVGDRM